MSKSADNEEIEEWLFDSIVGYLSSPIWRNPIEHFFEQNCAIFSPDEPNNQTEDEPPFIPAEYLAAHIKYRHLVDALINTFLQDLGVTYKQFLLACKSPARFTNQHVYLELFEQIWATENLNMFKSQMIKKNVELELQALILLQFQLGMSKRVSKGGSLTEEDEIMACVIRNSKDEYDRQSKNVSADDYGTAKMISKGYEDIEKSLQHEIDQQAYLNRKAVKQELKNPHPIEQEVKSERPASAVKRPASARKGTNVPTDQQQPSSITHSYLNSIPATSDAELKRRAEFMERQRELLTEKKRAERAKQLEKYMQGSKSGGGGGAASQASRPMSSKAARQVLQGSEVGEIVQGSQGARSVSDEEKKRVEARRALADTLKREVISQSKR